VFAPIRDFLAAERPDDAAVWRSSSAVADEELRAAIPSLRAQAQPWGMIGMVLRRRWLNQPVSSNGDSSSPLPAPHGRPQ